MWVREGYSGSGTVISVDEPVYLVELWRPASADGSSWQCAEYELRGGDVGEVLRWAEEHTPHDGASRYVVYACSAPLVGAAQDSEVHIRLAGSDPSATQTHSGTLRW